MKDLVFDKMRHQLVVRDSLLVYASEYSHILSPARRKDVGEVLARVQEIVRINGMPPLSLEQTREAITSLERELDGRSTANGR